MWYRGTIERKSAVPIFSFTSILKLRILNSVALYGEVVDIASVEFCGKIEEQEVTRRVDGLEGGKS